MVLHTCVLCNQLVTPEVLGPGPLWYEGHNPFPLRSTGR